MSGDFETEGAQFEDNDDGLLVNLESVQEQKFEVLPKNKYNVIIEDVDYQLSKSSGKPMWNLKLSVLDEEYQNRKLFTFFSFSEKALPNTKAALAVVAPELLSTQFNPKNPEIVSSLIGRKAKVQVGIQKGTDEYPDDRNNVKRWFQPDEANSF